MQSSSLVFQVLSLSDSDLDEVHSFAERALQARVSDETARVFESWSAKWRREALEHYLRLGWSFIAREHGRTAGFFLAQPFLFFRGQTQTLWVEHIEAPEARVREALVEVAVRVAREKHLQRVLFADGDRLEPELGRWNPVRLTETESIAEIKTTKG